jgi:hypothetical protein
MKHRYDEMQARLFNIVRPSNDDDSEAEDELHQAEPLEFFEVGSK